MQVLSKTKMTQNLADVDLRKRELAPSRHRETQDLPLANLIGEGMRKSRNKQDGADNELRSVSVGRGGDGPTQQRGVCAGRRVVEGAVNAGIYLTIDP